MLDIKSRLAHFLPLITLAALCAALYFPYLGKIPFFDKGEPREAILVQEIFFHGDWLFPLKWGEEVPSKPPLFHWFAALTSLAWGQINESTVRFPSALFATLGIIILYFFGRRLFDQKVSLYSAVILATSVVYQSEAIVARVEMTLTFFLTATLVVFYLLYCGFLTGPFWTYGFYLLLGVGVLAKGPVGLILPGMIIGCFLVLRKRWDFLWRLFFHRGVVLALVIGISWYAMALLRGGEDFFNRQIIHENLARFFVSGEGGTGHQKPFFYYFPYLILEGLPWSLFLPFSMVDWFKKKTFTQDHSLFLALWVGFIFLFFSFSAGKRAVYLLPLYPPLSLLIGSWLGQTKSEKIYGVGLKTVGWLFLIVGIILLLPVGIFFAGKDFSWLLSHIGVMLRPEDQAQFSIVQDALRRAGWFPPFFLFLSAFLWLLTSRYLFVANARAATALLVILSVLTSLVVQGMAISSIAEARSYKSFMVEVNRRVPRDEVLNIYGEGWDYTSSVFYRGEPLSILRGNPLSLQQKMRESDSYFVMGEKEWKEMNASGVFSPELRSRGTGPEGEDLIVLIRGLKDRKGKP